MTTRNTKPDDAAPSSSGGQALRRRAEEIARKKAAQLPEDLEALSPEETRRTLHELQVHQIELEMQNEELRTAQLALEESRSGYADLYDFAPVGYFTISRNGRITAANLTGAALLGVGRPELIHHGFGRFVAPEEIDRWDRHRLDALQQEGTISCELALKREDGSIFYARLDSLRTAAQDGAFALRTTVADISERVQAEEELRYNSAIIAEANDAIITTKNDEGFTITNWNPGAEKIYGWKKKEVLGRSSMFLQNEYPDQDPTEVLEKILETGFYEGEVIQSRKDGTRVFIDAKLSARKDNKGETTDWLCINRDISERKQLEERIRQVRSDLLYAVSHDLKTPLMSLNQSQEMLNALDPGKALTQFQDYSEIWQRNLQRLEQMINNLVDSQRGEEDHFPLLLAPCDPAEMVQRVAEDLTGYALALQIQFDLKLEAVLEGSCDQEALTRVVENLLTNAVKFSQKGGRVEVRLRMEDQTLLLEVEDHGAGVSPEEQMGLFQPFQRGRSAQQKGIPGTGLGLYVCRRIMEAHGGSIALTSEEGQGTKVIVRLPWKQGAE